MDSRIVIALVLCRSCQSRIWTPYAEFWLECPACTCLARFACQNRPTRPPPCPPSAPLLAKGEGGGEPAPEAEAAGGGARLLLSRFGEQRCEKNSYCEGQCLTPKGFQGTVSETKLQPLPSLRSPQLCPPHRKT